MLENNDGPRIPKALPPNRRLPGPGCPGCPGVQAPADHILERRLLANGDTGISQTVATLRETAKAESKRTGKLYQVHGHHIVMKGTDTASGTIRPSTLESQALLRKYDIPLLADKQSLRTTDDLSNMSFAINGANGIHSKQYQDAVRDRLVAAESRGFDFVTRRLEVQKELTEMRKDLERNVAFWNNPR